MASSSGDQNIVQHKIFLSHAGTEKDFAEQLYEELNDIYPGRIFFARDTRALPKGEMFVDHMLSAARKCEVAVIVMSNDYFTRRWPMIELETFVEANRQCSKLKILPLFYKLSVEDFKDSTRQEKWFKIWEELMQTSSHGNSDTILTWKDALKSIYTQNGIKYIREEGEKAYRDKIVRSICDMVPPVTEFDVSRVQGKDVIRTFFREVEMLVLVLWVLCVVLRRFYDLFLDRFFRWLISSLRVRACVRESCKSQTLVLTPQEQEVSQASTDPSNLYDERMLESEVERDWRDYFSNPREWWDNRRCKRNSGTPDFKHIRSGRTLWIDGWYTPAWVKIIIILESTL